MRVFRQGCSDSIRRFASWAALGGVFLASPAQSAVVEVTRIDGSQVQGEVRSVAPRLELAASAGPESIDWADILTLGVKTAQSAASGPASNPASSPTSFASERSRFRMALADGSEFMAQIIGAADSDIRIQVLSRQEGRLPLDALRWLRVPSPAAVAAERIEQAQADALQGNLTEDVLVVMKDQQAVVLRGGARRVDEKGVRFAWNQREISIEWPRVAGLVLGRPQSRGAPLQARTRAGEVFAGRAAGGDAEHIALRSGVFDALLLAWDELERIEVRSERAVFLSDSQPRNYEFDPLFGPAWDYGLNVALDGGPLRMGGRNWSKAIVMHSQSRLIYALGGQFATFAAVAGVMDSCPQGAVNLRVVGDGKALWNAEDLRGGAAPLELAVDVSGVHELMLVVEYGPNLDLCDQVAWALPRLVRR